MCDNWQWNPPPPPTMFGPHLVVKLSSFEHENTSEELSL